MSWKVDVCCVCLPLRTGLLMWGYLGMVINYMSILTMLINVQDILSLRGYFDPVSYVELSLALAFSVIHFVFYIILIAGLHKKSRGLLEVFYGFNVITMLGTTVVMSLYIPLTVHRIADTRSAMLFAGITAGYTIITLLLQLYLIVAVRSLISKLEDDKDCSPSVNLTEEPDCVLHLYKTKDCDC